MKILIIDDVKTFCDSLEVILKDAGFEVSSALSGSEGINLAILERPDLILLDMDLPDVKGNEVLIEIKKKKIPTRVIIITGYEEYVSNPFELGKTGISNYWVKGKETPEQLINKIKRAIAMDSTVNLTQKKINSKNQELTAENVFLTNENKKLKKKIEDLSSQKYENLIKEKRKELFIITFIRILFLTISVGITFLLKYFSPITEWWIMFLFPITTYFLLLLPIEKVNKVILNTIGTSIEVAMNSSIKKIEENKQNQLPNNNLEEG